MRRAARLRRCLSILCIGSMVLSAFVDAHAASVTDGTRATARTVRNPALALEPA